MIPVKKLLTPTWVSFKPSEPAAAEGAKNFCTAWSHVGTQSVHET